MAKIVFLTATVVILFATIELGASEVKCGGHYASSCSSCPQGNGESWCNGDCTWRSGRCVSKSSNGGGRSISGRSTPPAPKLYTSCRDKQKTKYQTLQSAWDDCIRDSSCTGVIDYDCDNDNYRLCYGQPRSSSSDTCMYRNSGSQEDNSGSSGGCVQSDDSDSWYFKNKGKAILKKHNKLRRQNGLPDLKWSARIEYEVYDIMHNKNPGCTHEATNDYKADIKSKAGDILKCEKNWLGHFENIAIGHSSELAGVQAWINEGPGVGPDHGHYENIVNPDVKWIGCYTKDKCYKCVYWGV